MDAASGGSFTRYRRIVTIVVVAVGVFAAISDVISDTDRSLTLFQVSVLVVAVLSFLALDLRQEALLDEEPAPWKTPVYLVVQTALLVLMEVVLQSVSGVWIMALPLIGTAVGRLMGGQRLLALVLIVAALVAPTGLMDGWEAAVNYTVSFIPAVVFVSLFVLLLVNAENARAEGEVLTRQLEEANRELADYATQAEELAITQERNRLAREIHDTLGHYLTVANVQLEAARALIKDEPERAVEALTKAQKLTQDGLKAVRESVAALRESPIDALPLSEAIGALLEETDNSGVVTEFDVRGTHRSLDRKVKLALYRVAQEGLTNVQKHARASRVDLILDFQNPEEICLEIQDNGVGVAAKSDGGFGLLGVRERVELLGGGMETETAAGQGFKLVVVVPG